MNTATIEDRIIDRAYREGIKPPETLTISEWADQYRILSATETKEPGPWRTARFPFLKEIMDALSPSSGITHVILTGGTQIGKTENGNNLVGYTIHKNPGNIMIVMPTEKVATAHSEMKLEPMIESSSVLRERISPSRKRDSKNTILKKRFPMGWLLIQGANSSSDLRNKTIKILILEEVDEYQSNLNSQGDTIQIALRRTDAFGKAKKIFMVSSPGGFQGMSRIEQEFKNSDQRHYYVPCPFCNHRQYLRWKDGDWNGDGPFRISFTHDENYNLTSEVTYCCESCGKLIPEYYKTAMFAEGRWIPHNPGNPRHGYKIPSFYSPLGFLSWTEIVTEFLEARRENDLEKLKTWLNTRLAETWDDTIQPFIPISALMNKCEAYGPEVPMAALVLTCTADIQHDRIEAQVKAHGPHEESWVIEYKVFDGNPALGQVWEDLEAYLNTTWRHQSGAEMKLNITLIDARYLSDSVYKFVAKLRRKGKCIFSTMGSQYPGKPIFERMRRKRGSNTRNDFFIGTDTGKDTVLYRLFNTMKKTVETELYKPLTEKPIELYPYFMHFKKSCCDEEYFAQLTAEKPVKKKFKRLYEKIRDRNEVLDLTVLDLAAIRILRPNWKRVIEKLAKNAEKNKSGDAEPQLIPEVKKYKLTPSDSQLQEERQPAEEKPMPKPKNKFIRRTIQRGWVC